MSQQSQVDILEEVLSWDQQKCLDNVDNTLPKIISKLEESAYIEEGIGILKIICGTFLECVPSDQLEDRVYSHVCKAICSLVDSSLSKIQLNVQGALKDTTEQIKVVVLECMEWIMDIIECVEMCVKHALDVSSFVELSHVQSLPNCAIHVLKQTYSHCKDSTNFYGDMLEHIGEPLSALFRKAHSLQMSVLTLLEKVIITGAHLEEHVLVLCSVCRGLFDLCGLVTCLDIKLVISLWKGIAKVCSQHLSLLRDRLDVCPLINALCQEVGQGYQYLFQLCPAADPESLSQGDDKAFSKSVKILGFQMKVLVALLRDFAAYLGNCEGSVLNLLLLLHRHLPPSLCASQIAEKQEGEIRVQLVNATLPILGHLMSNRAFRSKLTSGLQERSTEDRFPLLLLQLMVLDLLPKYGADVIGQWLTPVNHNSDTSTEGLLTAIFDCVHLCEVEMRVPVMLPGVMVDGKPQRQVSLYEHTATHICGFVGACLSQHFSILEDTLLKCVLGENELVSLLTSDCWCFLVRYGTAQVCSDHVHTLMQVYTKLRPQQPQLSYKHRCAHRLARLLQRLVKFMSPEHQAALLKQFPPSIDPHLWITLTLSCLHDDLAKTAGQRLVAWGLTVLQGTSGKVTNVLQAIKLFTDVLSSGPPISDIISTQQQASLLASVCHMWSHIHATSKEKGLIREQLISRLLPLTKLLLPMLETGNTLKVLMVVHNYMKSSHTQDLALSAADFLFGFGHLRIAPSFQQSQVLDRLPQVFHALLSHRDPLVHHRAMTAFAEFASHTVHEETIPACIQGSQELQERVENFLNKVPYQSSHHQFVLLDHLRHQMKEGGRDKDETGTDKCEVGGGDGREAEEEANGAGSGVTAETERLMDPVYGGNQSDDGINSDPPTKRAKLTDTREVIPNDTCQDSSTFSAPTATAAMSSSPASHYQTFLQTLTTLASDLELECSRSAPPPQWFVDASKIALTRINDCIAPNNNWFDSLN